MQLTYNEVVDILYAKYIAGSTIGYTLPPGVYEISDINVKVLMLKSSLPNKVKVYITLIEIRLESKLATIKTIRFTENSFFLRYIKFYGITLGSIM